ncbi:MAG: helix-turn-helix domain-containing protein [Acidimicrobiia bacterium]
MRPEREYREAVRLIKSGMNDSAIGRELDIPRGTVRDWRHGIESGSGGRTRSFTGERRGHARCPLCSGDGPVDEVAYAYLLGAYLGDGCLSLHPRDVYRLRICL